VNPISETLVWGEKGYRYLDLIKSSALRMVNHWFEKVKNI